MIQVPKTIEELKEVLISKHQSLNDFILAMSLKRLSQMKGLSLKDIYSIVFITKTSKDTAIIMTELAKTKQESLELISQILKQTSYDTYNSTKEMHDYKGVKFTPLHHEKKLSNKISKIVADTRKEYIRAMDNLVMNTPSDDKSKPTKIKDVYSKIINTFANTPEDNLTNVVKKTIGAKLLTVLYDATGKKSLHQCDTFLDGLVENSVYSLKQTILDYVGEKLGTDGVEISVHVRPADDHAPVQGHQFSNEEFNKMQSDRTFHDLQGRYYSAFARKIGTWNCRHLVYPIFIGKNKQQYTDKQLQDILDKNEKGVNFPNGKHLTLYQLQQHGKYLKRKVHNLKRAKKLAKIYGDKDLVNSINSKLTKAKLDYDTFNDKYSKFVKS